MKFRFWGVRGSIPSPGPHTVRYGGNTTCIEVRTGAGTLIVLDAGTGVHALAQALMGRRAADGASIDAHIFITHSHWDHIHGLPFFTPLYAPGTRVSLYGARDAASGQGIAHVLRVQLQDSYFPVAEERMAAAIAYRTLAPGEACALADAVVHNVVMNHPVTNYGYRVECDGRALFFTGDHEPFSNPHDTNDPRHAAAQCDIDRRQADIDRLAGGVDALIADCSYTLDEYPARRGWGHGTFDAAIALALRAGARSLFCTHHEPARTDDELEAVFAAVMARWRGRTGLLRVELAREGLEVAL